MLFKAVNTLMLLLYTSLVYGAVNATAASCWLLFFSIGGAEEMFAILTRYVYTFNRNYYVNIQKKDDGNPSLPPPLKIHSSGETLEVG